MRFKQPEPNFVPKAHVEPLCNTNTVRGRASITSVVTVIVTVIVIVTVTVTIIGSGSKCTLSTKSSIT